MTNTTSATAAQTAETIIAQLGGRRFSAMTGAKDFGFQTLKTGETALTFRLPRAAAKGINHIMITLNHSDTYTVTFSKYRALNLTEISEHSFIYGDQLQDLFGRITGLYTSL